MTTTAIIKSMNDVELAARAMSGSGFFQDARQASQAIVKILAGQELGFGPFASMTGVYIIQGRPAISANLMAAAVKRSGRYDYRITELTDDAAEVEFLQDGRPVGRSRFTAADARKAGTKNLDKYPRNMLFARAISNGVRWFCPDVLGGGAVYTPDELGATLAEDGQVIDVPASAAANGHSAEPDEPPFAEPPAMTLAEAEAVTTSDGTPYGEVEPGRLPHMARAIEKRLRENHLDGQQQDDLLRKLQAIQIILAAQPA